MFEIIHTNNEVDIKDEFVAIGAYVDAEKIPGHSVLIIKFKNQIFQFHYTGIPGVGILFDDSVGNNCFHKITNTIDEKLIPAFIVMCRRILKKANPRYGYFYSGEYFTKEGEHFSDKVVGETMTCSGFCLNVLKGFLENDYLVYQDWSTPTYPTIDYLEKYALRYNLEINNIEKSHRRISPLELLCSGYFSLIPIRKTQIDSKVIETQEYLTNY